MLNKKNKILLFAIFFAFMQVSPANAEYPSEARITSKEKAVFSFFSAANSSPDYDYWIKSNSIYETLLPKSQENYLLKETLRLGRGYGLFNKDTDLLELKINVLAKYISATENEKPQISFNFFDTSDKYTPTFNYPYGDEIISLIINRLAKFSNIKLSGSQDIAVSSKVPHKDETFGAQLTVHVRASKANHKRPISIDPVKQWLMVGEIAYLRCDVYSYETGGKYMLWDYIAPWHEEEYIIKNTPKEEKYPHPFDLFKD